MKTNFCAKRNTVHIVVVYVKSFYPSARSSSFCLAFCLHFYGTIFWGANCLFLYSLLANNASVLTTPGGFALWIPGDSETTSISASSSGGPISIGPF